MDIRFNSRAVHKGELAHHRNAFKKNIKPITRHISIFFSSESDTMHGISFINSFEPIIIHTKILTKIDTSYFHFHVLQSDIDSCPNSELQSVFNVLEVLKDMPKEFESREWIVNELGNRGIEKSVALWICTSVKPKLGGNYEWGFNLTMIEQLFNDFCDTDMWNFLENYDGNGTIHFIRAGRNPSWTNKVLERFKSLESNKNILLHEMPDVGHWIHAEDLNGMFKIITKESGLS